MKGVRFTEGRHAPLLAAIHETAFDTDERWSASAITELLAMPGTWALTTTGRTAMAIFRVAADEAEVLTLAVRPEARRQGAARRLLAAGAELAAARGAATLFLEVSARNAPALALYLGQGFGRTGLRRRYYADGADAVTMAMALPLPASGSAGS